MGNPRIETAALAGSVVAMADQIMQGVRENREHNPTEAQEHYVKAAIAGAIAIGAYTMLQKDENEERQKSGEPPMGYDKPPAPPDPKHRRDMMLEAAGAYALGRQMMGHKENAILKLIAEGLGAVALARETDKDVVDQ
ncbi:hypothetical protein QBC47DRAFT_412369 [Echria macrotheca]|uniref:Uncharacterized protein n=1 Tax=Echria macrotheca TaxID=438768 RepID=A0AAJ0BJH0_9PEZI|nr:hypothetical protein QBC47DRAFT_412369 [Echria macrotheca]